MDKLTLFAVVLTFFLAGMFVGAWAMRDVYRRHYGRALARVTAKPPAPPDPLGGTE